MKFNTLTGKISLVMLVFALAGFAVMTGCRKSSPQNKSQSSASSQVVQREPNAAVSKSLKDIISSASGWGPILSDFYGKTMPDFTVTDIAGQAHKLSDYRGRNVMIVLWATWCVPCLQEIPHLIALRDIMSADKLAILAISNEPADVVKAMARDRDLNYTVISNKGVLPEPLSGIRGYPSAFFVKPDGTLKLATEGGLRLGEMKAIILAE